MEDQFHFVHINVLSGEEPVHKVVMVVFNGHSQGSHPVTNLIHIDVGLGYKILCDLKKVVSIDVFLSKNANTYVQVSHPSSNMNHLLPIGILFGSIHSPIPYNFLKHASAVVTDNFQVETF